MNDIICGDSEEVLKDFDADSIDCIATDPQYGWGFMGKSWDAVLPPPAIWSECLRVLKPGALAFIMCGARTDGLWRMGRDIESVGFDVSLQPILWCYNSGFPKALDISKDFDRAAFLGWVADKYTKIVCIFVHKHKRLTKRKVDCPECKRIVWAFCESYMDELTLAHVRKATSAAVNGAYFPSDGSQRKRGGMCEDWNGEGEGKFGGVVNPNTEGIILLSSLVSRFWSPLSEREKLEVWRPHLIGVSVEELKDMQGRQWHGDPRDDDPQNSLPTHPALKFLSLPPGVRVKLGEKTESGYPDGDGIAYYKNRSQSDGSQVATGGTVTITAPSVDLAKQWDGYKSHALKPAYEICIVARKPMSEKPIRENVKRWGVGGYNIDAGRIPFSEGDPGINSAKASRTNQPTGDSENTIGISNEDVVERYARMDLSRGRFPANLISSGGEDFDMDKLLRLQRVVKDANP